MKEKLNKIMLFVIKYYWLISIALIILAYIIVTSSGFDKKVMIRLHTVSSGAWERMILVKTRHTVHMICIVIPVTLMTTI